MADGSTTASITTVGRGVTHAAVVSGLAAPEGTTTSDR